MVGGTVIGVAYKDGRTLVNVTDAYGSTAAIRVRGGSSIRPGDQIWWQSRLALWTPQENIGRIDLIGSIDYDIPLERIGHSH